eukprot:CAMPEP_0204341440 /NCGR_PEP_ID=MMETSP0469-20131031/23364_1 /ASSEMBLY_ACC=CAM_ASM_000384 /TAXON_ID=2969 /ORGANISM="Oxyrrhis marina" /LENGTH=35 /DNA_ID= /DNA_START= /DNA_END= /DNA_ORIENTATION=
MGALVPATRAPPNHHQSAAQTSAVAAPQRSTGHRQ